MPQVAANQSRPTFDIRGFVPIELELLAPTAALDFDLYLQVGSRPTVVLYRKQRDSFQEGDHDRLIEHGIDTLFVRSSAHEVFRRYLLENIVQDERVAPLQRYRILKTATHSIFDAAFRSVNLEGFVQVADELGEQMVAIVCNKDMVISDLISMMEHNYYAYTHVANVCTCCLALASALGIRRKSDLLAMSSGALLHDVGNRRIPPGLLNKPTRLTESEREIIRQHPLIGFEELSLRGGVTWGQLMMIYQHHERMDGSGYPVQLIGEETHEWARICMIADVFDALISDRPYRRGRSLNDVLEFLEQRAGREFDKEMVQCWIATIRCGS